MSVCVCVCVSMEVSNHPGLMATQLRQSTQTPLRNSRGGLGGGMKEEENNTVKSSGGDIPGFLSNFAQKCWLCVHFIFSRAASLPCLYLSSAPDHYHVPLTRFKMKLRNSEPPCDIWPGCVKPAQSGFP